MALFCQAGSFVWLGLVLVVVYRNAISIDSTQFIFESIEPAGTITPDIGRRRSLFITPIHVSTKKMSAAPRVSVVDSHLIS